MRQRKLDHMRLTVLDEADGFHLAAARRAFLGVRIVVRHNRGFRFAPTVNQHLIVSKVDSSVRPVLDASPRSRRINLLE